MSSSAAEEKQTGGGLELKLAVVTGGNSGIGFETCSQLLELNYRVVMCCRSLEKGNHAREAIQKRGIDISKLFLIQLDLADLDNVDSFRGRFDETLGKETPIDALILNAGLFSKFVS